MEIFKEILIPKKVFNTEKIKKGDECLLCYDYSYNTDTYNYIYHCTVVDIACDGSMLRIKENEGHLSLYSDGIKFAEHYIKPDEINLKGMKYIEFDKSKWDRLIKEADYVDGRDTWYE